MHRIFLIVVLVLAASLPGNAGASQASDVVVTDHARTHLALEQTSAVPGEPLLLGLLQTVEPGWHVYWQNPGDSGLPLSLDWTLPEGVSVGPVQYPLPERLPLGPLVNYGHTDDPVFLIPLTVGEDAHPGSIIPISVKVTWLICKDICVPEEAEFRIDVPVSQNQGNPNGRDAVRIADAVRRQPSPAPFEATYYDGEAGPVLVLDGPPDGPVEFFPYAPSIIEPSASVRMSSEGDRRYFAFVGGFAYDAARPERLSGVAVVNRFGRRRGYTIAASRTEAPANAPDFRSAALGSAPAERSEGSSTSATGERITSHSDLSAPPLLPALGLAFLGGLILNIMPCVFPIIFLKATSFASIAHTHRAQLRVHGLVYTAGVLTAFALLGLVLILLRAGGEGLGWGFHLQSPVAVSLFAAILFLVGLNLAGVFEVGTSVQGVGDELTRMKGAAGAYFTGVLAVAVAAPCVGPFLGGALGLALMQPPLAGLLIFIFIGIGLASPYLLFSLLPKAASVLPKPGPWLSVARQIFSFALFASVVWLVWVLAQQTGPNGVLKIGVTLLLVAVAAWAFGVSQKDSGRRSRPVARLVAGVSVVGAMWTVISVDRAQTSALAGNGIEVDAATDGAWSPEREALARTHGPVFVDFTAAWCITCQVNKRVVLDNSRVRAAFLEAGVTYLVADWTRRDDQITAALARFGRAGVPLYLYYADGAASPKILPQLLSVEGVLETVMGEEPVS